MSKWQPIATAPKDRTIRITNDPDTWVYVQWSPDGFWTDGDDIWTISEVDGWLWAEAVAAAA